MCLDSLSEIRDNLFGCLVGLLDFLDSLLGCLGSVSAYLNCPTIRAAFLVHKMFVRVFKHFVLLSSHPATLAFLTVVTVSGCLRLSACMLLSLSDYLDYFSRYPTNLYVGLPFVRVP